MVGKQSTKLMDYIAMMDPHSNSVLSICMVHVGTLTSVAHTFTSSPIRKARGAREKAARASMMERTTAKSSDMTPVSPEGDGWYTGILVHVVRSWQVSALGLLACPTKRSANQPGGEPTQPNITIDTSLQTPTIPPANGACHDPRRPVGPTRFAPTTWSNSL